VCGDSVDLVDGKPTGSVRVSFGYMSTFDNCQNFLNFVVDCFVERPARVDQARLEHLRQTQAAVHGRDSSEKLSPIKPKPLIKVNGGIERGDDETRGPAEETPEPSPDGRGGGHGSVGDISRPKTPYSLTNIYIYPVKSCAALEVCGSTTCFTEHCPKTHDDISARITINTYAYIHRGAISH